MWGSDWPVLNLAADYPRWAEATDALLESSTAEQRDAVLGGNAIRFYGLASGVSL